MTAPLTPEALDPIEAEKVIEKARPLAETFGDNTMFGQLFLTADAQQAELRRLRTETVTTKYHDQIVGDAQREIHDLEGQVVRLRIENEHSGVGLIASERARHEAEEGYDAEHDRGHAGALALAASGYALAGADDLGAAPYVANQADDPPFDWPWHDSYWKPTGDPVRDLVKAGALIAAAIDSVLLDRVALTGEATTP
jgi:hypothetical protein